jgi:hypothetical protein
MRGFSYSVHAPPLPLAGLVDHFWSLSDVPSHSRERVIPSGTLELVVNLHEDEFRVERPMRTGEESTRLRGAIVSGAYSGSFVVETRAHASIVGVHFKPGAATTLLGVPSGALANVHVELEALWGGQAAELRDRLCVAADSAQRFRILEHALSGRLSRSPGVRGEIAIALGRLGAPRVKVNDVVRQVRLSHRRFVELFTEQVGMTPKRYSRVRRFSGRAQVGDGPGVAGLGRGRARVRLRRSGSPLPRLGGVEEEWKIRHRRPTCRGNRGQVGAA